MKNSDHSKREAVGRPSSLPAKLPMEENQEYAKAARKRLEQVLSDIRKEQKLSVQEMMDKLSPYISKPYAFSKMIALSGKDKRHIPLLLAFAMRRAFGISLDEIADGHATGPTQIEEELRAWMNVMPPSLRSLISKKNPKK